MKKDLSLENYEWLINNQYLTSSEMIFDVETIMKNKGISYEDLQTNLVQQKNEIKKEETAKLLKR